MDNAPVFEWKLPDGDAKLLASMLDIEIDSIKSRSTRANIEAPICESCGRQIGLLDVAKNALERSVHEGKFLGAFFSHADVSEIASKEALIRVSEVEHNVSCFECGSPQKAKPKWKLLFWN